MIISFAWTTPAFLAGRKDTTRREWTDEHAAKFAKYPDFQAWDHVPRVRGAKRVGYGRIVAPLVKEHIRTIPDTDYEREGFGHLEEQGLTIWGKTPRQAFEDWRKMDRTYWVVRFEKMEPKALSGSEPRIERP